MDESIDMYVRKKFCHYESRLICNFSGDRVYIGRAVMDESFDMYVWKKFCHYESRLICNFSGEYVSSGILVVRTR